MASFTMVDMYVYRINHWHKTHRPLYAVRTILTIPLYRYIFISIRINNKQSLTSVTAIVPGLFQQYHTAMTNNVNTFKYTNNLPQYLCYTRSILICGVYRRYIYKLLGEIPEFTDQCSKYIVFHSCCAPYIKYWYIKIKKFWKFYWGEHYSHFRVEHC